MVNKIVWSNTALTDLGRILLYLREEISESASEKFADAVKFKITQLAANTFDGRPVPTRRSIRFVLLGKYHRLYYRRHGLTLYIARFYDARQDPNKRPY